MVEYLLENGADVNTVGNDGKITIYLSSIAAEKPTFPQNVTDGQKLTLILLYPEKKT